MKSLKECWKCSIEHEQNEHEQKRSVEREQKRSMGWKKGMVSFTVLLLAFLIGSCEAGGNTEPASRTEDKTFENIPLNKRNVLAVTNMSQWDATLKFGFAERSAVQNRIAAIQPRLAAQGKSGAFRQDLEAASRFNANPPVFQRPSSRAAVESPRYKTYNPNGETFWVTDEGDQFYQITATLRGQGNHCNVWVDNNSFGTGTGKINLNTAQNLASRFDQIYPLATNLLGYEYGGGPNADEPRGGVDGDERIQILVHDIAEEGVVGYFWSKDEYTQEQLGDDPRPNVKRLKSNLAEIFYVDVEFLSKYPNVVYSTLIHEFQHMINFNEKAVQRDAASETWYDEMLAMLAEDVIGPLIGIAANSAGHPIKERIPLFLGSYWFTGITQWPRGEEIFSYSATYAFGAYLIRNYGGPDLIYAMLHNDAADQDSITQALRSVNKNNSLSFDTALSSYFKALLYSTINTGAPGNRTTFDRSWSETIAGTLYTATAFDIWGMEMDGELLKQFQKEDKDGVLVGDYKKGPFILPLLTGNSSPGYSVCLYKYPDNLPRNLNVTLTVTPESIVDPKNVVIAMEMESY